MILAKVLIIITFGTASQCLARAATKSLYEKIKNVAKEMSDNNDDNSELKMESDSLNVLEDKRKKLGFITMIVSLIEFTIFTVATIFILTKFNIEYYEIFKIISLVFGGWFAIKIIGNYGQWSGIYFGRATFYTFLIGTLINVVCGVLLGWILLLLTF